MRDLIKHDALLWLVVFFNSSDWCISILAVHSGICSLGGLLSHSSPVVVVFDRGHPRFWNFYSTIPADVVRVKSHMNCLFDPARVVIRVTINKLYFVPEWLVSGVVGMLWNGGGLGTGVSNVSIVLLNSVLHRSSSFSDVHLATSTRNPVNYAILFSFPVLVSFCKKEKWITIKNRNRWQMFFLLGDDGGFCKETVSALVKALDNTAFYWLRVVWIIR